MTELKRNGDKMSPILLPCPFCGGEAQMHTRFDSLESFANKKSEIPKMARLVCERKYPNKPKYYVYRQLLYVPQCTRTNCMGRTTKNFEFEEDAIKAWNTRTQKEG